MLATLTRLALVICLVAIAAGRVPPIADAAGRDGCNTAACQTRVLVKVTHARWRAVVEAYGTAKLRARERCESGGAGGWRLTTTGNGFWFGHQFTPSSWAAVGGRLRGGVPIGRWARHPSRLEQDYRAVRLDAIQDDPWPNCP